MNIVSLKDLNNYDFALSDISAIKLIPKNKTISYDQTGRILNGFLYILEGKCQFSSNNKNFIMESGSLAYLPKGSKHLYTAITDYICYLRIDFKMTDIFSSEEIIFTKEPLLLFSYTPNYYESIANDIISAFLSGVYGSKLKCTALLYDFIYELSIQNYKELFINPEHKKIIISISYIEKNYTEDISTAKLSKLCYLSPTHFRRLFKKHTGMTPTDYKTKIRIEKACILLKNQSCNISEISNQLGFDSVSYFSRVFKKVIGISPNVYRNNPFDNHIYDNIADKSR